MASKFPFNQFAWAYIHPINAKYCFIQELCWCWRLDDKEGKHGSFTNGTYTPHLCAENHLKYYRGYNNVIDKVLAFKDWKSTKENDKWTCDYNMSCCGSLLELQIKVYWWPKEGRFSSLGI